MLILIPLKHRSNRRPWRILYHIYNHNLFVVFKNTTLRLQTFTALKPKAKQTKKLIGISYNSDEKYIHRLYCCHKWSISIHNSAWAVLHFSEFRQFNFQFYIVFPFRFFSSHLIKWTKWLTHLVGRLMRLKRNEKREIIEETERRIWVKMKWIEWAPKIRKQWTKSCHRKSKHWRISQSILKIFFNS